MSIQLDYLIFAAVAAIVFGVLQRLAWRGGSRVWLRVMGATIAGVILLCGWVFVERAGMKERQQIEQMLCGYAPTYAEELTRMGHAAVTTETKSDDSQYLAM